MLCRGNAGRFSGWYSKIKAIRKLPKSFPLVWKRSNPIKNKEKLYFLERRIRELGMDPQDYWWYLDLRRYGGCRHAGFGLGFERMVMYLTGVGNIRDVLPHPRTVGNAEF